MKKAFALFLALCMMFALCACGQTEAPAQPETPAEPQTETPAEAPAETTGWAPNGPVTMIVAYKAATAPTSPRASLRSTPRSTSARPSSSRTLTAAPAPSAGLRSPRLRPTA